MISVAPPLSFRTPSIPSQRRYGPSQKSLGDTPAARPPGELSQNYKNRFLQITRMMFGMAPVKRI